MTLARRIHRVHIRPELQELLQPLVIAKTNMARLTKPLHIIPKLQGSKASLPGTRIHHYMKGSLLDDPRFHLPAVLTGLSTQPQALKSRSFRNVWPGRR